MANARRYVGPIDDDKAISTKQYVDEKALPTISSGDGGKLIAAKVDESGYELVDAPSGGGGASSAEIMTIATIESYL